MAPTLSPTASSTGLSDGVLAGLLLASGFGRRFDAGGRRNKLLARLPDGRTVAAASARALCAVLEHVAVVVPARGTLLEASLSDLPVDLVRNPRAKEGMGASIAVGIAALDAHFPAAKGWIIALGDMPFVMPRTIVALAEAFVAGGHRIVAPVYRGRRGHPVVFDRSLTAELIGLEGDVGASSLLAAHPVHLVDSDDPGVVQDVDTRDDLVPTAPSA